MKNTETKQEKRSWWVIEFDVESRHEEMASWLMIHQLAANGCQFMSSENGKTTLQASFEPDLVSPERLQPVYAALDEYGLGAVAATIRINKLEEEDWLLEWKKGMQPIQLGDRFLISPPWFKNQIPAATSAGRHIIWIEPGMAFGTGFHTTTQFCLRAIEKHLFDMDTADNGNLTILDVGTGSGILAIAASHILTNAKIVAVEIDPVACRVAAENLSLNQAAERIQLVEGSIEKVTGQTFDAILSNLTCEDNIALLPDYVQLLKPNGKAIMSGILLEKAPLIEKELEKYPFAVIEKSPENIWMGLVIQKREYR